MKPCSSWMSLVRHLPSALMPKFSLTGDEQKRRRTRLSRMLFSSLLVGVIVLSNVAYAQSASEDASHRRSAEITLDRVLVPDIKIIIGKDSVATVCGTVTSDVVKSEIVEALLMTDGIRGVINRLVVAS